MAYKISTTHQFEKDLKRCIKRGYPMDKFRTAILIVRRVRLQAPPSAPPVASFFQPTLSFNYRRKAHI